MSDVSGNIRVLLVDDSMTDRTRSAGLIAKGQPDWQITAVPGGEEALEYLALERPDIVITDLVMPGIDGRKLLQIMGEDYPSVPVVLITSQGDDRIAAECVSLGAVSYVPKRLLAEKLLAVIRDVIVQEEETKATRSVLRYVIQNRCRFEIESELEQIWSLVNFVRKRLHATDHFSPARVQAMTTAVRESLLNAHFHGNFEANSRPLELPRNEYIALAAKRKDRQPYVDRRIRLLMSLEPDRISFQIGDDGPGFDHSLVATLKGAPEERFPNGNGIRQLRTSVESVQWNDSGNEVTLTNAINGLHE